MKKSSHSESPTNKVRYHILGADGLYAPISFLFVTDRMCQEIDEERRMILDNTPAANQPRQRKLFERYNPHHSSSAFNSMLNLFTLDKKE